MTPEFTALLVGLVVNASASISEIIRSGIRSVKSGQWEAARLIVLPQALHTADDVELSRSDQDSSLAVAIGFPDFVSVANTNRKHDGPGLRSDYDHRRRLSDAQYRHLDPDEHLNQRVALKGGQRR